MSDCEIERKCKNCGKKISILYPNQWVYKTEKHKGLSWDWYCSWHCMREAEKKRKPKKMNVIA